MASFNKKITERKNKEINNLYFRTRENNTGESSGASALDLFNSVYRFHLSFHSNEIYRPMKIKDCYTLTLANAIIDKLTSENVIAGKDLSLPEKFYDELAEPVRTDDGDMELAVISLKQMVNIMRKGGIIFYDENRVILSENFHDKESLYFRLLESFWNETDWSDIFPSSPESAEKLYRHRNIFSDLIQGFYIEVSVEDLCNDFFNMTEMADKNDYFMISFIDFYLIAWLKNFGIIDYAYSRNNEIVYVSIQDYGREILRRLV